MGYRIVLTADRTLMSSYNGSQFVGFAACFPRVLPRRLYARLFCPTERGAGGLAPVAPAGLRRIEGALLAAGVPREDIALAYPDRLSKVIDHDTKVVGISTSDPLGLGPASSTFSGLMSRETYTRYFFRQLLSDPALRRSGAKVVVGGPGTWQLARDVDRDALGIDCVVEGEGDLVAPRLFMDAVSGKALPRVVAGGAVPMDHVPRLPGPTVNGTVEISRGCGRGCEFCSPNMRLVRHMPLDRILDEVRLNLGFRDKITLHAEDVLRYKADGLRPRKDEVVRLFEEVSRLTDNVGMSHIALSSALSEPSLVEEISRITGSSKKGKHCYAQTGVETGSPRLVSMHMKGKARPYKPEEWPTVVKESMKLLSDNNWIACATLVMGLPGEKREDVEKTAEMVRDLRPYKSLIVPLFFVPLGNMTDSEFFDTEKMLPEHWILLAECIDHDFFWAQTLMQELFSQNGLSKTKSHLFGLAARYMGWRLRPYLEEMREGRSPLEVDEDDLGARPLIRERAEA